MVHASSSLNAIRRPVVGLEVASRRPDRGRIVGPLRTASIALKRPFLGPPPNSDGIATTSTFSGRRDSSPIPRRSVRDGLGLTDRGRFFCAAAQVVWPATGASLDALGRGRNAHVWHLGPLARRRTRKPPPFPALVRCRSCLPWNNQRSVASKVGDRWATARPGRRRPHR